MALFKRKQSIPVKTDKMVLPEVVRQIMKEKKLPTETKESMIKALEERNISKADVKHLMAGRKKIDENEFKELGKVLIEKKVPGLLKYSSGTALVNSYIKAQQKKQARFRLFRLQREDEEKEALQKKTRGVSIKDQGMSSHSALENKRATSSALDNKQATTSAFENLPTSSIGNKPEGKSFRIKPPV